MLGIDVSKNTLACTLLDPVSKQSEWQGSVPNSPEGVQQLLQLVPVETPWVMEPTGRYSLLAVHLARAAGRRVLLAGPREAKAFLQSQFPRAKTDRVDSIGLAYFALSQPLRPYPVKSEAIDQLEQLLRARRGMVEAITSLKQRREDLPRAAGPLQGAITGLQGQLKQLDAEIAKVVSDAKTFPEVAALDAVPGIGTLTAATVGACLKSKQFTHPDQFVAYVGLDLTVRDSGQSKGRRTLSHRGDAELRRLLYLAAQANIRCKASPFRDQYVRERAKGLAGTQAICAVARKLARVCWSLVHHGTTYKAERVNRQAHKHESEAHSKTLS
jgi:transposase